MPPKKITPDGTAEQQQQQQQQQATMTFRENEMRFVKAMFDHMNEKPNTDWSKVAEDMGLKGVKSAKDRFYQLSIRHGWGMQAAPGSNGSSPVKAGKKSSATIGSEGKVSKKPRTPKKAVKKEFVGEDVDVDVDDEDADDEKMEGVKIEGDDSAWDIGI